MAKSSVAMRKVGAGELARLLGLPEPEIARLKRNGVLRSSGKRDKLTFQVGESIRAYIQHRRAATESEQNVDFHRERAKKERAERRLREMLLEQTTGLVHASEDIRGVQSERYGMIRSRLIALPNALALRVTGQTREEIRGVRGCITFRDLYAPTHEIARNFVSTTLLCWPYGRKHRAIFRSIVASLKHWPAGRKVAF
jgi:hypothetical protein